MQRKARAVTGAALDAHAATVGLHSVAHEAEATPAAVGLGGAGYPATIEWLEEVRQIGRLDAGAVVAHAGLKLGAPTVRPRRRAPARPCR